MVHQMVKARVSNRVKWLVPPWYHPTEVVAVDDEEALLHALREVFEEGFRIVPCETVAAARRALAESHRTLNGGGNALVFGNPLDAGRFSLASVMLVDFALSGTTGLQLIREFADHPARRILYSGMSDVDCVEEALREGVVDRFIAKHDPRFLERLEESVEALAWRYFIDAGREALGPPPTSFASEEVADLLWRLREEYGCVEHYLYRDFSGFLLIDEEGACYRLVLGGEAPAGEVLERGGIEGEAPLGWWLISLDEPFAGERITPFAEVIEARW